MNGTFRYAANGTAQDAIGQRNHAGMNQLHLVKRNQTDQAIFKLMGLLHFIAAGSYHPTWGLIITGGQDSNMVASTLVDGLTEKNEIAVYPGDHKLPGMIRCTSSHSCYLFSPFLCMVSTIKKSHVR